MRKMFVARYYIFVECVSRFDSKKTSNYTFENAKMIC